MSNGLLHGLCGGLLRGCCHRTAKSANTGANDIVDLTDLPNKDYGPVTNDPSEFYYAPHIFTSFCLVLKKKNIILFNLYFVRFACALFIGILVEFKFCVIFARRGRRAGVDIDLF